MNARPLAIALTALALGTFYACSCEDSVPLGSPCTTNEECGGDGSCVDGTCQLAAGADASEEGADAAALDGGPRAECLLPGAPCAAGQTPGCCSGSLCRAADGGSACTPVGVGGCAAAGEVCSTPTDCCSLNCSNGRCSSTACAQQGAACAAASACCSGTCSGGKCAAIPGATCKNLGEACGNGSECCSQNCQGGSCVQASFCNAGGDVCYKNTDCCTAACLVPAVGQVGTCAAGLTGAGGGNCSVAGEPCSSSSTCCSHLCADIGTGKATCVLGSGCRETGEVCGHNVDCCGESYAFVTCNLALTDPPVGRCSNPKGCQPVGNCCGATGANCRQDCCLATGNGNDKKLVCHEDQAGLARCFGANTSTCPTGPDGLDPKCCIQAGNECQFHDQCCNLAPCIQVNGKYVCQAPTCVQAGQKCTPGATGTGACCSGMTCASTGELGGYTCRSVTVVPGPDGGMGDAGACAPNGAGCSTGSTCCSGSCIGGTCGVCKQDGNGCGAGGECCSGVCSGGTCATLPSCAGLGGACSGNAECCSGLTCNIVVGQPNGTCQQGAGCGTAGQACTVNAPCCSGYKCANSATGVTCAAGDALCVCRTLLQ